VPLSDGDLPVGLGALLLLAVRVLNEHIKQADCRAVCGSGWPCERASLAKHNLATL
jgi:hypothetical protein